MSARRNNQLPPPVEPDLPPLEPGEEPLPPMDMLPGEDPMFAEDLYGSGAPQDVVNDVTQSTEVRRAEPNLKPTGAFMDLGFIQQLNNAASDEEFNAMYDALDPALKHVYDRSYGMQISPKWAADTAQEYYQMQDRAAAQANSPAQQAAQRVATEKTKATQDSINLMRGVIDDILKHPGFSGSVGAKNQAYLFGLKSQPFSGTKEADFLPLLEQLEGGAFLQAYQSLKGGGSITEPEGQKATQALVRAQRSQSEEGFKKSLNDFRQVLDNAEKRLNSGETMQPQAAAPTAPQTKKVGNQTWVRTPDGWLPQR
jgi:hypothetical protein